MVDLEVYVKPISAATVINIRIPHQRCASWKEDSLFALKESVFEV